MYITLFMDVEDLIAPESDDIAGLCAEILTQEMARSTLCIVGEKARLLARRGRHDIILALKQHDIGLHTDLHSIHPTVLEYLAPRGWEDGIQEAIRREGPGVQAIWEVFGVAPSCWGGAGNTWGPQISAALRHIGVPALIYAHTCVPEGNVHRFEGILTYPNGYSLPDGDYHSDTRAASNLQQLVAKLAADVKAGVYWRSVFVGHPSRIMSVSFWDGHNFGKGQNPPRTQWTPAPRKSPEDLNSALVNFRKAISTLRSISGIEVCALDEMNAKLASLPAKPVNQRELYNVWPQIEANLRGMAQWPILPPNFNLDSIVAMTHSRLGTLQRLQLPHRV